MSAGLSGMIHRLRRWLWYERGAEFAEEGVWASRPVAYIQPYGGWAFCCALLFLLFIGLMFTPLYGFFGSWTVLFPFGVSYGPLLFFWSRMSRVKRAMKGSVVKARGLVCPRCLYDLRGAGAI